MTEDDLEPAYIAWFDDLGWDYKGEVIFPGGATPERSRYGEVVLTDAERSRAQPHHFAPGSAGVHCHG